MYVCVCVCVCVYIYIYSKYVTILIHMFTSGTVIHYIE